MSSLYILEIRLLFEISLANMFSHIGLSLYGSRNAALETIESLFANPKTSLTHLKSLADVVKYVDLGNKTPSCRT